MCILASREIPSSCIVLFFWAMFCMQPKIQVSKPSYEGANSRILCVVLSQQSERPLQMLLFIVMARLQRILFFQVCRRLGIIEVDYFGLQFTGNKGENLWLNLRNRISQQMDGLAPYRLKLRVKFFVEPHLILQEQTR